MFETLSRMQQGDLGEARAIFELVRLGYSVSKPLHVHLPYDLIADKDGTLYRVQVKTTRLVCHQTTRAMTVNISTSGGNTKVNTQKPFDNTLVDLVFVMTSDDRCWLIPAAEITSVKTIVVGTPKHAQYQIAGWTPAAVEPCPSDKADRRKVVAPFTPHELQQLLLTIPTTQIASMYGLSDNGVARWAKKWNLTKPGRGYWRKTNTSLNARDGTTS